jgi:hypothetical protein
VTERNVERAGTRFIVNQLHRKRLAFFYRFFRHDSATIVVFFHKKRLHESPYWRNDEA